jgi:hypothetical protein
VVVIGRAIAFFNHPLARLGAVIAVVHFLYQLVLKVVHVIAILSQEGTGPGTMLGMSLNHWTLFGVVQSFSYAFFILALAVIVEYAARISSDFRRIRARREIERSEGA